MSKSHDFEGERRTRVAYLLWFTFIGHRLYLGRPVVLYSLTLGYYIFGWLADLFRIPAWVREYNSHIYLKGVARGLSTMVEEAPRSPEGPAIREGNALPREEAELPESWLGHDLPWMEKGVVARIVQWTKENPLRMAILGLIGLVVAGSVVAAAITGSGEKSISKPSYTSDARPGTGVSQQDLAMEIIEPKEDLVSSSSVNLAGRTEPGALVTVSGGKGRKAELQAGDDGYFSCPVELAEGRNVLVVEAELNGRKARREKTVEYRLDEASYKALCTGIDYRDLKKNPDAFRGRKYVAQGKVVQILESGGETHMRVKVTGSQWDVLEGIVYVIYTGPVSAYEDSVVKFWGDVQGSHTYTSVAGWTVTLPLVEARYVEVLRR